MALTRRASFIKRTRKYHPDIIVVDAGNAIDRDFELGRLRSEIMLTAMNLMVYDALNMGDRELSHEIQTFERHRTLAQFPFLSANATADIETPLLPSIVFDREPIQVGILGLVGLPQQGDHYFRSPFQVKDPVPIAAQWVAELRQKTDVVIVLGAMDAIQRNHLLQEVPDIDIFIHSQFPDPFRYPLTVGKTLVLSPGWGGGYIGQLTLYFDGGGHLVSHDHQLIELKETMPTDPSIDSLSIEFDRRLAELNARISSRHR